MICLMDNNLPIFGLEQYAVQYIYYFYEFKYNYKLPTWEMNAISEYKIMVCSEADPL